MADTDTDEAKAVDRLVAKLVPYLRDGAEKFAAIEIRLKYIETEVDKLAEIVKDGNPSLVTEFALLRHELRAVADDLESHDVADAAKHSKFEMDLKAIAEKLAKDLKELIERQTVPATVKWQTKATIAGVAITGLVALIVALINYFK